MATGAPVEVATIAGGAERGELPSPEEALTLLAAEGHCRTLLLNAAARLRDRHHPWITFSRNAFFPLTTLCRYDCGYCTFYRSPGVEGAGYMSLAEVQDLAGEARRRGCTEALFTLGEKPEERHPRARELLSALGFSRTNDYLVEACSLVLDGTGLLPHSNPGVLTEAELLQLREVNASMGLMLESTSTDLVLPGGPHHGCGGKHPRVRLATMEAAGRLRIPWTTGLLIGIGETLQDRVDSLYAIRKLQLLYRHVQEVIIQPFVPHQFTPMASHPAPSVGELVRVMAVARLVLPPEVSLQAPPNLTPASCGLLLRAGANDWGGISPVTIDHINPGHPWPPAERLRAITEAEGLRMRERLPIYPRFALDPSFQHGPAAGAIGAWADAEGYARGRPL